MVIIAYHLLILVCSTDQLIELLYGPIDSELK